MKSNLYNLTQQGMEIFDLLSEAVGEITPEIEARIDALMMDGPVAMEAAAMVVRSLEANAKACEEEAVRIRERAKSFDEQADKLKARMTMCLDAAFGGKLKTPLFTIWTQQKAKTIKADLVPGVDLKMLQEERPDLVRVKLEIDRVKIVGEYKAGRPLPELILFEEKEGERSVRIK